MVDTITNIFDWANFIAISAGVIGAATGILSLVKVHKLKSLDLRVERGRIKNTTQVALNDLNELYKKANQSRIYRLAAQGLSKSGPMQKWEIQIEQNKQQIEELSNQFSTFKQDSSHISVKNLESDILELHLIGEKVKSLTDGFISSIAEDDVARDRLQRMKFGT